jgi:hypothetical protein
MWFLSGLILAVLGVHGFYLGRVFAEVKRRPRLLVEQTTDVGAPDGDTLGTPLGGRRATVLGAPRSTAAE